MLGETPNHDIEAGFLSGEKASRRDGMRRPVCFILLALRILLGAIFVYAGIRKAMDPAGFAADLRGFRILPEMAVEPLAAYVPFLEIFVGAALILGFPYSGALVLSGGFLGVFLIFVGSALWRGLDISCGCFGSRHSAVSLEVAMLRNVLLLAAWTILVFSRIRRVNRIDKSLP